MNRILITGANSYIGTSVELYLNKWSDRYVVDTIDMIDGTWKNADFSVYDVIYHVAGIAHSDSGKISKERAQLYYDVNTNLTIETAKKAKTEGVKQFIFMSSAIVYGNSAPIGKEKCITKDTPVGPANAYGDSKVKAEEGLIQLEDDFFKVVILRPPMIYGKGSKGNYPLLSKMAQKFPVFPYVNNCRSMLYVDNLAEFVRLIIDNEDHGLFWPQNEEYSNTSKLVQLIGEAHSKKVFLIKGFAWVLKLLGCFTSIIDKAFGNLYYDKNLSTYQSNYQVCGLRDSIFISESAKVEKKNYPAVTQNYSVLMSVYKNDNTSFLKTAIDSMLNQTLPPNQFVIVIDGPVCDELEKTIKGYQDANADLFSVIKLEKNGGLGNALNHGLAVCRNELIARMDADDISLCGRCEKQVNKFLDNPELTFLGTQIDEFMDEPSNVISSRQVPISYEAIRKFARRRSPFNHPTVMFRKSALESLNGYMTYGRKEDLDLFIRAVNEGFYVENLNESLLLYRTSNDNLSRRKTWNNCSEYIKIMWNFYRKGYCGFFDIVYIVVGQTIMYLTPSKLTRIISNKYLRTKTSN